MTVILLDGAQIANMAQVHETFAAALDFPAYYGGNLDALHDVLTEIAGEIGVIAVNTAALEKALGRRWQSLRHMLTDVAAERESFHLCIDPFDKA